MCAEEGWRRIDSYSLVAGREGGHKGFEEMARWRADMMPGTVHSPRQLSQCSQVTATNLEGSLDLQNKGMCTADNLAQLTDKLVLANSQHTNASRSAKSSHSFQAWLHRPRHLFNIWKSPLCWASPSHL